MAKKIIDMTCMPCCGGDAQSSASSASESSSGCCCPGVFNPGQDVRQLLADISGITNDDCGDCAADLNGLFPLDCAPGSSGDCNLLFGTKSGIGDFSWLCGWAYTNADNTCDGTAPDPPDFSPCVLQGCPGFQFLRACLYGDRDQNPSHFRLYLIWHGSNGSGCAPTIEWTWSWDKAGANALLDASDLAQPAATLAAFGITGNCFPCGGDPSGQTAEITPVLCDA